MIDITVLVLLAASRALLIPLLAGEDGDKGEVRGTEGNDLILGGNNRDVLNGREGNDTMNVDDLFYGGFAAVGNDDNNNDIADEKNTVTLVTGTATPSDDAGSTDFHALVNIEDDVEAFAIIDKFDNGNSSSGVKQTPRTKIYRYLLKRIAGSMLFTPMRLTMITLRPKPLLPLLQRRSVCIQTSDPRSNSARGLFRRADRCICALMKKVFDMDDRARLPWRFFGARCTILARG